MDGLQATLDYDVRLSFRGRPENMYAQINVPWPAMQRWLLVVGAHMTCDFLRFGDVVAFSPLTAISLFCSKKQYRSKGYNSRNVIGCLGEVRQ